VPVVSRRDPRSAFRGLWTGRQTAVQSATSLAFNWWFLALGSAACSRITSINGPFWPKTGINANFNVAFNRHSKHSYMGVIKIHIFGATRALELSKCYERGSE
jgi:hypothetical protein